MGFNTQAALTAAVIPRMEDVPVPELADFFDDGAQPIWTVRNLSANELIIAEEAKGNMRREAAVAEALTAGNRSKIVENLGAVLGRNADDIQPSTAQRLELLRMGSVEPECPLELANWMAANHAVVFLNLSNKILQLSGRGSDVEKKPNGSGGTKESNSPSH